MSTPLEKVNVSKAFQEAEPYMLVSSEDHRLDGFEYCWGLSRGDLSKYYGHPDNFLYVQPALKQAFLNKSVALIPTDRTLSDIREFQHANHYTPAKPRKPLFEAMPFGKYSFRVVALKPEISLSTKRARTGRVATKKLKLNPSQGPIVSTHAHPIFVMAHFSWDLRGQQDLLGTELSKALRSVSLHWSVTPPLTFYEGAYRGDFGRAIPPHYRSQFTFPPPKELAAAEISSSSGSSSTNGSDRSSKRSRSSSDDGEGPDVAKWVTECESTELETCVVDDILVAGYREETARSAEDVLKALRERTDASPISISLPVTRSSKKRRNAQ